ncbi:MAG: pre-peptidase C-terminal domain-containing protein [Polyangiaceae bacterium]|nr:pre-peptidase C-terminal domain-containing protein [Polyangiaceae bacterium]
MRTTLVFAIALSIGGFAACDDKTGSTPTQSVAGKGGGGAGGDLGGMGGMGGSIAPGALGAPCKDNASCEGGACILETELGWPGGHCSSACSGMEACAEGSECITFVATGDSYCLRACDPAADACGAGYTCLDLGDVAVCVAGCIEDAQCKELPSCNVEQGLCFGPEQCGDAKDNDLDGDADCQDFDCEPSCKELVEAACTAPKEAQPSNDGDTSAEKDLFEGSCTGGGAPDTVFSYKAPGDGLLTLSFDSGNADMGVYVRSACNAAATEVACANDIGPDALEVPVKSGEELSIFVDGYELPEDKGPFTLSLGFQAAEPEDCADAKDNDLDKLFDCDDPDCETTCGPLATTACAGAAPLLPMNAGDSSAGAGVFSGTCAGGGAAKENVYVFTPPATGELKLSLSSTTNHGLYLRSTCDDKATEVSCVNSAVGGAPETLSIALMADVPVYVFVDGSAGPMDAGAFDLASTFTPALCGDDKVTLPEECDDGALAGVDGCDAMCKFVPQSEAEPNNAAATSNMVHEGKVTAAIMPAAESDWFAVAVPGPMSTIVATTGGSKGSSCQPAGGAMGIDTEIQILDTDGIKELAKNDDIFYMAGGPQDNYCSSAKVAGLAAGTYYVRVSSSAMFCPNCTFNYSVTFSIE